MNPVLADMFEYWGEKNGLEIGYARFVFLYLVFLVWFVFWLRGSSKRLASWFLMIGTVGLSVWLFFTSKVWFPLEASLVLSVTVVARQRAHDVSKGILVVWAFVRAGTLFRGGSHWMIGFPIDFVLGLVVTGIIGFAIWGLSSLFVDKS